MDYTIRPYKVNDIQQILDVINYNILNTNSLYDYNTRTLEQQRAILEDKTLKNFPVIVAEFKGKVVGFGMFSEFRFREANKFTVEHSVYVLDKMAGKGIGKLVLSQLIQIAKSQGYHTMIGVVDSENQSSINFHEKFGFKTVGVIKESAYKFDQWLDTVFLQLML